MTDIDPQAVKEQSARAIKARKLCDKLVALYDRHGTFDPLLQAEAAAKLDRNAWRILAANAGCNPPSDLTIQVVLRMLRARAT